MFDETGCVPGIDGEEVRAETMVPDAKEYISESIDDPKVLCDSETWDRPGFTLGNLEQYSLSAISALAERAVTALVPR